MPGGMPLQGFEIVEKKKHQQQHETLKNGRVLGAFGMTHACHKATCVKDNGEAEHRAVG